MLKSLILLTALIFVMSLITNGQEGMPVSVRPCGTDRLLQQLRKNPSYLERERTINQVILQKHNMNVSGAPPAIITLPVVVHIINENPNAYTDAAVVQAIQALNDAYSASGSFAGGRTDTRIRFCLARTAPDGGRTTGIIRTYSYLSDFDVDMEGNQITALGAWDRNRYINIWVVSTIRSEYMQDFECGTWTRLTMGGYASAGGDVVVTSLGADLVAHEMGHYLNLIHTFANRDCLNDNCMTDGDMVCDTPPERRITGGYACSAPPNSCSTDTLSGFTTDVPDLPDNIMDYGTGSGCILGFTEGQAERMRNFIAAGLPLMQASTVCNDPCGAAVTATFTPDKAYPVVGDVVTFTATASPGQTFQWLVDGTPAGTGQTLQVTVTEKKTYQLELRVTDNASGCHASTTNALQVNCGVVARFYPDKRKIASKEGIQTDHVVFTNRSRNATSWKWLMSDDKGTEQILGTNEQLDYTFKIPGTYKVRLYATNGSCEDISNPVTIVVDDPTADGIIYVWRVDCYQQDKVRVELYFQNTGYVTIPKNTPVSFYDGDPRTGKAHLLGKPFLLPDDLRGKCVSYLYTTIVDVGRPGLDTLVTVMNDNGSTLPLNLPNTGMQEVTYYNNINITTGIGFHASINPVDYTLKPTEQAALKPVAVSGGDISKATWDISPYLSCTDCINNTFTALYRRDTVTTVKVRPYTQYGCYNDLQVKVHIPVVDDYTIKLNALDCSGSDDVHVKFSLCNGYAQGNIPANLQVDFYDRSPGDPAAVKLGNSFLTPSNSSGVCNNYELDITRPATGKLYAVINKDQLAYPPATGLNETIYSNNTHNIDYTAPVLTILPKDTTVFRKAPFNLNYNVTGLSPVSVLWGNSDAYTLSCNTCSSPVASMLDSGMVNLQMTNQYGCALKAQEYVHIFPPDMTVELLSADCYDNDHVLAKFRVCMNNGYDTVYKNIPVSFYNGEPGDPQTVMLSPRYYTPAPVFDACREFTHVFNAPGTSKIVAVVNEGPMFKETNYSNNGSDLNYIPFSIKANPAEITAPRQTSVTLKTTVSGGTASKYLWEPLSGLSCQDCEEPITMATSSTKYQVTATNEYYCTDTTSVNIYTFVNAPVAIPNAFSPNGDGKNDYFYVIGSSDIKKVRNLSVFNRFGQKVFESRNSPPNNREYGWDGTINGKRVDTGTYVYQAMLEYMDGSVQVIKGTITVIR